MSESRFRTQEEYHAFLRSQTPKREDFPKAGDDEWEEILAGYHHRVSPALRPQVPLLKDLPKDSEKA